MEKLKKGGYNVNSINKKIKKKSKSIVTNTPVIKVKKTKLKKQLNEARTFNGFTWKRVHVRNKYRIYVFYEGKIKTHIPYKFVTNLKTKKRESNLRYINLKKEPKYIKIENTFRGVNKRQLNNFEKSVKRKAKIKVKKQYSSYITTFRFNICSHSKNNISNQFINNKFDKEFKYISIEDMIKRNLSGGEINLIYSTINKGVYVVGGYVYKLFGFNAIKEKWEIIDRISFNF